MHTLTCADNFGLDRLMLKKLLSPYGSLFDINSTELGNKLIYMLSKESEDLPGIILLDIGLPGFNAWDFLDKINWLYPKLAKPGEVYIISSVKCAADIARAKQYKFVKAFILKPITKEVLQGLMKQKSGAFSSFTTLEAYC